MKWINDGYKPGTWVEVKPVAEILATLDASGAVDELPFMPEMVQYCGRRFRVFKSAHKTCDTVHGTGGRRMQNAVHLDGLRCDGSGHGQCEARCLLFWKTAWLRPVDGPGASDDDVPSESIPTMLSEQASSDIADGAIRYRCQATRLYDATTPLSRLQLTQYVADVASKNVRPTEALRILFMAAIYRLREIGIGYRIAVGLYDSLHRIVFGTNAPKWTGTIPAGQRTPDERLHLEVGELVTVRSMDEIRATLDPNGRNRGLTFDPEMTPYCGKTFRVAARVENIVNETTGEMMHFGNPCIVLDQVFCMGRYSALRLMCPRRITPYWREIWLRRADARGDMCRDSATTPVAIGQSYVNERSG